MFTGLKIVILRLQCTEFKTKYGACIVIVVSFDLLTTHIYFIHTCIVIVLPSHFFFYYFILSVSCYVRCLEIWFSLVLLVQISFFERERGREKKCAIERKFHIIGYCSWFSCSKIEKKCYFFFILIVFFSAFSCCCQAQFFHYWSFDVAKFLWKCINVLRFFMHSISLPFFFLACLLCIHIVLLAINFTCILFKAYWHCSLWRKQTHTNTEL